MRRRILHRTPAVAALRVTRTTGRGDYAVSRLTRKRIEEAFCWIKTVAAQEKTRRWRGSHLMGPFASLPPPPIWCGCSGRSRRPADCQGARLRQAFAERWRIVEIDVLAKRRISPSRTRWRNCLRLSRVTWTCASACAEFAWEGHDENDPSCGRGLATRQPSLANASEFFNSLTRSCS